MNLVVSTPPSQSSGNQLYCKKEKTHFVFLFLDGCRDTKVKPACPAGGAPTGALLGHGAIQKNLLWDVSLSRPATQRQFK